LSEGSFNKYYTDARAVAATSAAGYLNLTQVVTEITNRAYTLPKATTTTLGGVKGDGNTLSIDGNGVISVLSQDIAFTGDVTGSGNGTIGVYLVNIGGLSPGVYGNSTTIPIINVDAKGRVIGMSSVAAAAPTTAATQAWGVANTTLATTAFVDRFRDVQSVSVANYTLALTDRGQCIETSTNVTIPANSAVAFPIGTVIQVLNTSATPITISLTTDTMRLIGTTTTGTRTLAGYGLATFMKRINATTWFATGVGLS
jgi:hypothetical protein